MRILLCADQLPFPIRDGESLRIYPLARRLAARHELHFVGFGGQPPPPELEGVFARVVQVAERPARRPSRLLDTFSPDRWRTHSRALQAAVDELLAEERYDLAWIPTMQMVPYLAGRAQPPLFIDVMDDAVLEHLRDLRHSRSPRALLRHLLQLIVSFRFERTYFRGAAALCLVSERDAAFISRLVPGARTVVIHNGVDAEKFRPLGSPPHHPSVIFEGTMSFPPNVDAVQYFHAEIFPLVRREVPGTVFYIVGRDPAPEVRALAGPDTIVTGSVEDVRPYYDRASVFACTMRRGAGIKNKILQAWAMCIPVVATTVATGGLLIEPGVNIEVADRPPDIAAAIVRLLGDPGARRRLGQAGRATVLAHYSWDTKCQELEQAFEECLRLRGSRPG